MGVDKYDFIIDLIESKKLSIPQKEKILDLSIIELKKDKIDDEEIKTRLKRLEESFKVNVYNENPRKGLPQYLDPSYSVKFLKEYNQDPILKTTCHEVDVDELNNILKITGVEEYNFYKHYQAIIASYNSLIRRHPKADHKLKGLINSYLGKNLDKPNEGWSSNKIKVNWQCEPLLKWVESHPGIPPNPSESLSEKYASIGFEFDEIQNLHLKTFSELVIYFKKLFHIRKDNPLINHIRNINKEQSWESDIDFIIEETSFISRIEFFTDVDKVIQAYTRIIRMILEESENNSKPRVELKLTLHDSKILFSICHIDSIFSRSSDNLISRIGQTHSNLIEKQINGLCNLYIQANFENDKSWRINLWNEEEMNKIELDSCKGVEHILEFK